MHIAPSACLLLKLRHRIVRRPKPNQTKPHDFMPQFSWGPDGQPALTIRHGSRGTSRWVLPQLLRHSSLSQLGPRHCHPHTPFLLCPSRFLTHRICERNQNGCLKLLSYGIICHPATVTARSSVGENLESGNFVSPTQVSTVTKSNQVSIKKIPSPLCLFSPLHLYQCCSS